jgi:hypothetical protein
MTNARRNSFLMNTCYMFRQYFTPKGSDKISHNGTQSQVAGARVGSLFPNIPPTEKLTLKEHPNLLTELGKNKKVDVALKPIQEILAS